MKQLTTFVEHYNYDGKFQTDIWFDETDKKYRSVVTDLYELTFINLDDIRVAITRIMKGELK